MYIRQSDNETYITAHAPVFGPPSGYGGQLFGQAGAEETKREAEGPDTPHASTDAVRDGGRRTPPEPIDRTDGACRDVPVSGHPGEGKRRPADGRGDLSPHFPPPGKASLLSRLWPLPGKPATALPSAEWLVVMAGIWLLCGDTRDDDLWLLLILLLFVK